MYCFAEDKHRKDKMTLIVLEMFAFDTFESVRPFCKNEKLQLLRDL